MKVSVCVITYNHEEYIGQCLDSILTQEFQGDLEIVIGEDGSKDATRENILQIASRHSGTIRLLADEGNLGMMPNFMRTLQACHGDYIALCEGDDYWTDPFKLQKQVDFMEQHPDFSVCFTNTSYLDSSTGSLQAVQTSDKRTLTIEDLFVRNYIATQTVLYRNVGMDFPSGFTDLQVGDWPLHVLMAQHGKIRHLDEYTAVYRVHDSNAWQAKSFRYKEEKLIAAAEYLYEHVKGEYRSLAKRKLIKSYYLLANRCLMEGDSIGALAYYTKLRKISRRGLSKEIVVLKAKLELNRIKAAL